MIFRIYKEISIVSSLKWEKKIIFSYLLCNTNKTLKTHREISILNIYYETRYENKANWTWSTLEEYITTPSFITVVIINHLYNITMVYKILEVTEFWQEGICAKNSSSVSTNVPLWWVVGARAVADISPLGKLLCVMVGGWNRTARQVSPRC